MQRLLTFFCTVLLAAGFLSPAHAQENRLFVNGGLAIPLSDFADDGDPSDEGFAGIGFGVTGDYLVPLGSPGLDWATSASVTANTVEEEFFGTDVDTGFWINVPLLTGLRYQTQVSPTVDVFGLGQIGLNIVRGPSGDADDGEVSPGIATTLGFGFGGGIVLSNRIQISLRYLTLGEPELEFDVDFDDPNRQDGEIEREVPISILQLTVGIPLGGN